MPTRYTKDTVGPPPETLRETKVSKGLTINHIVIHPHMLHLCSKANASGLAPLGDWRRAMSLLKCTKVI